MAITITNAYRKILRWNKSANTVYNWMSDTYQKYNGGYIGYGDATGQYVSIYKVTFDKPVGSFRFQLCRYSSDGNGTSTIYLKVCRTEDETYYNYSNIISGADAALTLPKAAYSEGSCTVTGDFAAGEWYIFCTTTNDYSQMAQTYDYATGSKVYQSGVMEATLQSYTLSISAGAGSSIRVNRTASPNAGAASGQLSNGQTVYPGDVLSFSFTPDTGYRITGYTLSGETHTVGEDGYGTFGITGYTVTGNVSVATTAAMSGLAHIVTADGWGAYEAYIDNGESWERYIPYIDNGESWEMCS